jgi:hypothetical protein
MRKTSIGGLGPADPWSIREHDFPARGALADKLEFLVGYAVLASSHYNTQPWRFRVGAEAVDLLADRSRALPVADPADRLLAIGCGAALFNLCTAARAFGLATTVRTLPDSAQPDWLARVNVTGECVPADRDQQLLVAMTTRRTHRGALDAGEPSPSLLRAVGEAVAGHGARFLLVGRNDLRDAIAELASDAEAALQSDAAFRDERERWVHDAAQRVQDGIPRAYVEDATCAPGFGVPEWSADVGTPPTPASRGHYQARLVRAGGVLAVVGTEGDSVADWLATGQGLKHGVLLARAAGIWAAYHAQPTQLPAFRQRLSDLIGYEGRPQMLIRLGHGYAPPQTPRRPVSQVVLR